MSDQTVFLIIFGIVLLCASLAPSVKRGSGFNNPHRWEAFGGKLKRPPPPGASNSTTARELRALVQQIEQDAAASPAYSIVVLPIQACVDHISAIARIHDVNHKAD